MRPAHILHSPKLREDASLLLSETCMAHIWTEQCCVFALPEDAAGQAELSQPRLLHKHAADYLEK